MGVGHRAVVAGDHAVEPAARDDVDQRELLWLAEIGPLHAAVSRRYPRSKLMTPILRVSRVMRRGSPLIRCSFNFMVRFGSISRAMRSWRPFQPLGPNRWLAIRPHLLRSS